MNRTGMSSLNIRHLDAIISGTERLFVDMVAHLLLSMQLYYTEMQM